MLFLPRIADATKRARAPRAGWWLALVVMPSVASAQTTAPSAPVVSLPPIEVIANAPLLGVGIDPDKLPSAVRSLSGRDLAREGSPSLTNALEQRVPAVTLNDVQVNPFQPDVQFRGFTASPVLGTPQGLAVYQNGVRVNEAFGDTLNWDLIPNFAINRINLVPSSPVFGLNALGGALALEMKDGFNSPGGHLELTGGSFGRRGGTIEYGQRSGDVAGYVGLHGLDEDGWRDHSPSSVRQAYADLGARRDQTQLHLSFSGASNELAAVGPTPVDLLAVDRSAVFTGPQTHRNDLAFLTLSASHQPVEGLSLDGNFYVRRFTQNTINGNTSSATACDPAQLPNTLCLGGQTTPLVGLNGQPIASVAGTPGSLDRTTTQSTGLGGTVQATSTAPLLERDNHLVVGASIDHGDTRFRALNEFGTVASDLSVAGTGIIVNQPNGTLAPVRLDAINRYYGVYATDTYDLTAALALTVGGRFNAAEIRIDDLIGTRLNGRHAFSRFNPAAGLAYKITPAVTAYGGYSEANRAPTAAELSCADPIRPCGLDNFLVADPALKQVVSRSYELGLRGASSFGDGELAWQLGVYRADNRDDIINVASPIIGRGFFQNAGATRRQGLETGASYRDARWLVFADYALVDATFRSALTLSSPDNPFADAAGQIQVRPGDRLPSIPEHRLKLGSDYQATGAWRIGATVLVAGSQFLRGDEANRIAPIPGYAVVDLHSTYQVAPGVEVFGLVRNAFDAKYETFGVFGDVTRAPLAQAPGASNPRFLSPAPPIAAFGGIRVSF